MTFCVLLYGSPATAARLSSCQGEFGAVRGPGYSFAVTPTGASLAPLQVEQIERGAAAIYRHWQELLSAPVPLVVDVRLELIADPLRFHARKQALAPDLPEVNGFYAQQGSIAVALVHPDKPRESRRRALHEVSHLITASQVGAAPHWLAEGLAEVHEMLEVGEYGLQFPLNHRHLGWLASEPAPSLLALFREPPQAWQGPSSHRLYARAWALIQFLLHSPEGRGALGFTLQQATIHSCGSYDAAAFMARAYPGGIVALENAWAHWLKTL